MDDGRRQAAAMVVAWALVCGSSPASGRATIVASNPRPVEEAMANGELVMRETTQHVIAGMDVGVSNIWERELPDANGVVATRVSATVSIHDPASGQVREQKVFAGSVISIGTESYTVVEVKEGTTSPGVLKLRKR